jgi:DNA repair protein RadD
LISAHGLLHPCGRTSQLALHEFFGVPYEPEEAEDKPSIATLIPPYILFDHQQRASLLIREKLGTGRRRVLLHMPTGAGKTRTAVTTLVDVLRSEPGGRVIVWLAHSEELCDQAFDEACRAWAALGSREMTVYRHYREHRIRDFREVTDGIVVAGLQLLYRDSLARQGEILDLARRVRVIVMDGDAVHRAEGAAGGGAGAGRAAAGEGEARDVRTL